MTKKLNPRKAFFSALLLVGIVLAFARCAHPVAPTGGPKDVRPPRIAESHPELGAAQFEGNTIRITFDEFVQLKDINGQTVISPPVKKKPEFKLRGKTLLVKWEDTLRENTTYSLFFGDAIQDIRENNIAKNLQFVFSTGETVDSMQLSGQVLNAYTLLPEEGVFVMLYKRNFDSIPYKEVPYYLSRTNKQGQFQLANLAPGPYKIFALRDNNNNLLFDLPNEQLAFLDSLIIPDFPPPFIPDSLRSDTLIRDSILSQFPPAKAYTLHLFEETDSLQRVESIKKVAHGQIQMVFRFSADTVKMHPLNVEDTENWYLSEWNPQKDTFNLWLVPPVPDTLQWIVSVDTLLPDTLETILLSNRITQRTRRKNQATTQTRFGFQPLSGRSGTFDYHQAFILQAPHPLVTTAFDSAYLIEEQDTLALSWTFSDSIHRKLLIQHDFQPGLNYTIILPDSAIFDLYGNANRPLKMSFLCRPENSFGHYFMTLNSPQPEALHRVQLMKENGQIVREITCRLPKRVAFENLDPGTYKVKVLIDWNENNQWDRGDYLRHLAPEPVYIFPKTIEIRSNWDLEERWTIGQAVEE